MKGRAPDWIATILMAAVVLLTTLAGSRYAWFAVDHLAYMSGAFRVLWLLTCVGVLLVLTEPRRSARWLMPVLLGAFLLSLPAARTMFPTYHGDGDLGGYPLLGLAPTWRQYPDENGRLSAFLGRWLDRALPDTWLLPFHHCGVGQSEAANTAWVLVTMLTGAALAMILYRTLRRGAMPVPAQCALFLTVVAAPPMAQAYGHFDSYIVAVAAAAWWAWAAWRYLAGSGTGAWWHLTFSTVAAVWAHPVLAVLAGHDVVLVLLTRTRLRAAGSSARVWLPAACVFSLWPYAVGAGNGDWFRPEVRPILAVLLEEKLLSMLQVALPAIVLLLTQARTRACEGRATARAFGGWLAVSSATVFLTLWTGFGVADEFLYGIPGTLILAGALLVWWSAGAEPRALAATAALSVFLFVPRVEVYRTDASWRRLHQHFPVDRCAAHRHVSPHRLLAQVTPVETPAFRERRLSVLREGFERPLPHLAGFADENRAAYVAWCLAFDDASRALPELAVLLTSGAGVLAELWSLDDPFHTGRYGEAVSWKARALARAVLEESARTGSLGDIQRRELAYLDMLERETANPYRVRADNGP